MNKKLFYLLILIVVTSCKGGKSNHEFSKNEKDQFLNEVVKNANVVIDGITKNHREPADQFLILTRHPLSEEKLKEYNENNGTIYYNENDIHHYATYVIKSYELLDENRNHLYLVDYGRAPYLAASSLWRYDGILCQHLTIDLKLNEKFEKLEGYIVIEFEMPDSFFKKMKKETKIPINITIDDKDL
ncbi:MAG: hypothetical protein GX992_01945 [Clostridium sp.]|nr:hypothetical protein [Clostridium sp.]